jgi:hypothetical protein
VVTCLDHSGVLTLFNLGAGGFSVHSPATLPVGSTLRFRFSTPDGNWTTMLSAKSVYSRPDKDSPLPAAPFLTGFKFLNPESEQVTASINALIDRATAVVSLS